MTCPSPPAIRLHNFISALPGSGFNAAARIKLWKKLTHPCKIIKRPAIPLESLLLKTGRDEPKLNAGEFFFKM
jgi:hypothetical protein